ncbi:MAG: hypothetical protein IJ733_17315 [Lachnospiraceae bacterium]|nr:hypothetical protein [Lachnospiraceae bacterium]
MQLGWVDYSREERETIKELLRALGDSGSLDELGVGIVRDSISDLLYPGTSVLHTRAKYYILIPELFQKAMESGLTTGSEVRNLIHTDQDKIARALRRATDEETGTKAEGIIGGRSDRAVKMKPTRIYWNALRTTGILCNPDMSFDDACSAVAGYNRKLQNVVIKYEGEDDGGDADDAGVGNFVLFNTPCKEKIEDYLMNPTLHLKREEAEYLCHQFLSVPVMKNTLTEYCLKTKTSFEGVPLADIPTGNMPELLRRHLELANEFADFIYGAYIVYNLLFFENGRGCATVDEKLKLENKYRIWKRNNRGLPHRNEILGLVRNHEHYKAALFDFLKEFENAVDANAKDICSDEEKRIVKQREQICKRGKAKIGKAGVGYDYQELHKTPMNYRHDTGQTIISDILKGMVREDAQTKI